MIERITFKQFPDEATAQEFAEVLTKASIEYEIEEDAVNFDPSYAFNSLSKSYNLKIAPNDFTKANEAFHDFYSAITDQVDKDYYLFSFSSEELREILEKPEEWGELDYELAKKILQERGEKVPDEQPVQALARSGASFVPETENLQTIIGYYVFSILFSPLGIIIGWIWGYSKKTLPDGSRVYRYEPRIRKHGRILTVWGWAIMLYAVVKALVANY